MELILLVLFVFFAATLSYGLDYIFELQFFKEIDEIERVLG